MIGFQLWLLMARKAAFANKLSRVVNVLSTGLSIHKKQSIPNLTHYRIAQPSPRRRNGRHKSRFSADK
jgi:hypothetical protein